MDGLLLRDLCAGFGDLLREDQHILQIGIAAVPMASVVSAVMRAVRHVIGFVMVFVIGFTIVLVMFHPVASPIFQPFYIQDIEKHNNYSTKHLILQSLFICIESVLSISGLVDGKTILQKLQKNRLWATQKAVFKSENYGFFGNVRIFAQARKKRSSKALIRENGFAILVGVTTQLMVCMS